MNQTAINHHRFDLSAEILPLSLDCHHWHKWSQTVRHRSWRSLELISPARRKTRIMVLFYEYLINYTTIFININFSRPFFFSSLLSLQKRRSCSWILGPGPPSPPRQRNKIESCAASNGSEGETKKWFYIFLNHKLTKYFEQEHLLRSKSVRCVANRRLSVGRCDERARRAGSSLARDLGEKEHDWRRSTNNPNDRYLFGARFEKGDGATRDNETQGRRDKNIHIY